MYLRNIGFLSHGPETSWPSRMQDSLNYIISKTSEGMMWNFCTWLDIHRSIKHSWLVVYTLGVFLVQKFGSAHFCLEKLAQFFWNKESYNKNCSKVFELYQLFMQYSLY